MDNFLKRTEPVAKKPKLTNESATPSNNASKVDFLRAATAVMEDKNRDVGLDKVEDLLNNVDNVVQFFELVKESDNIKAEIQQLHFAETLPLKPYKLIEVPKTVADNFKLGEKLIFRGTGEELVVLCSQNKTFDVKEVETSNSLLLVPHLKAAEDVTEIGEKRLETITITALSNHYLELKEIECVSAFRLRELLHENQLSWDWKTQPTDGNRYSFEELLNLIRMSEGQLRGHLKDMPVVEIDGYQRWLSYDFRDRMVEEIISACDDDAKTDVSVDKVTFEGLRSLFSPDFCDAAIEWFLRAFCTESAEESKEFKMNGRALVRSRASYILRNVSGLDIETFERHLDQNLPAGVELDYSHLEGLSIIGESFKGRIISYLNVEDLPEDPRERLKILFDKKPSWRMEEISPFLADICANAKAISGLLVAHCRAAKDDSGEKVFCSLRPV